MIDSGLAVLRFFFGHDLEIVRFFPYAVMGSGLAYSLDRKGSKPRGPWVTFLGGLVGGLLAMDWALYKTSDWEIAENLIRGVIRGTTLLGGTFGAIVLGQAWEWFSSGKWLVLALKLAPAWVRKLFEEKHGSGGVKVRETK